MNKGPWTILHFHWSTGTQLAALSGRSPSFRAWVTKHVTRQCGVGSKMYEWKFWETSNCPCCNQPDEITTHLPFCSNDSMREAYATQLEAFSDWLMESDTAPTMALFFKQAPELKTSPTTGIDSCVLHATHHQSLIGWNNMLFGRLAIAWSDLQATHIRHTNSR